MSRNLFDGGRWPNLSQNRLGIFDQPGSIAGAIGGLPRVGINARLLLNCLLLNCHGRSLELKDRCGAERNNRAADLQAV